MRSFLLLGALCVPSIHAFPWLRPEGMNALLNHPEAREEIERRFNGHAAQTAPEKAKRQLNTGVVNGVVTLLGGSLKAVVDPVLGLIPTNDAVKGLKRFPERMCSYFPKCSSKLTREQRIIHLSLLVRRINAAHALV